VHFPSHIAIIMDGNGRWASSNGLPRVEGHKQGTRSARTIVEECRRIGIKHLTLYAFSHENWARPKDEIDFLFNLLADFLRGELGTLIRQDIRLNILGEIDALPLSTRKVIQMACYKTRNNQSMHLNLALNYSGRLEIVRACRKILEQGLKPEDLTPEIFSTYLYTSGQPDPDLIIRTSGEYRISNYLLYQSAYSELYFTDTLWPEFTPDDLHQALQSFSQRQRRFGRI